MIAAGRTLGAAIIFLVWLWISNLVMLIGAEVNVLRARRRGDVDSGKSRAKARAEAEAEVRTPAPASAH